MRPPGHDDIETAGGKRAAEDHGLGVLADVDEAAGPHDLVAEAADIDVAGLVDLGKREKRQIEPAAVVEIELIGLVDHRLIVAPGARLVAGRRHAADQALLVGQHHVVDGVFFRRQRGDAGGNARAEIADGAAEQFEACPPRHHLARRERQRRDMRQRHLDLAGIGRIVHGEISLRLLGIDDDEIDQHAGDFHLLGRQRAALGHALDLGDDDAAGAARRLRHRDHLAEHRLVLHGDVAVLVGRGAAHQRDVDMERLEEQIVLVADLDELDEIFGGAFALLAAAVARIDEGIEPDMGDETGAARGHFAGQLREAPLRQRVGLDLVGRRHALDRRRIDQRAADHALEQAGMRQMPDAAAGAVAEADRMHGGEIARLALAEKAFGDGRDECVGNRMPGAGTADQQRVAAGDQFRGFIGTDDARRHGRS